MGDLFALGQGGGAVSTRHELEKHPTSRGSRIKGVMAVICLLYGGGALVLWLIYSLIGVSNPLISLLAALMPFLLVPILLTLPLGLLWRSKAILLASALIIVAFVARYGEALVPQAPREIPDNGIQLTVMTHNLGGRLADLDQIVAALRRESPDIAALQELPQGIGERLAAELADEYAMVRAPEGSATALLSRYPVVESEWAHAEDGPRHILAQIDVEGALVHVAAIHPPPPGITWFHVTRSPVGTLDAIPLGMNDALPQARVIDAVDRLAALSVPSLLMGDLNIGDQTRAYAVASERFTDVYRAAERGFGFTFPSGLRMGRWPVPGPFARLDYVFCSDEFTPMQARVNCETRSDHCYLAAKLMLTP
jgi:endonuclease/exonuclease/phosphatase family metal-dependent hydrolase